MRLIKPVLTGLAVAFLAGFTFINTSRCQAPEIDFQIWNETMFVKPVLKTKDSKGKDLNRLSLLFFGTLRLGQNRAFPVDKRVGAGFDLRLNDHFSITPTYLYRSGNPGRNVREFEHRIRFDLTFEKKWRNFSIKNRDRIEYRSRNSKSDKVRFRNKFTFKFPVRGDDAVIFEPFVATEPYYDITDNVWTSNEFSAGIARKLSKSVSAEFFYVHRNNRGTVSKHIDGLGANLKIVLP